MIDGDLSLNCVCIDLFMAPPNVCSIGHSLENHLVQYMYGAGEVWSKLTLNIVVILRRNLIV